MRPAGICTFSLFSAASMSATVRRRAASAVRSIQMRMAYRRSPVRRTRATPRQRGETIDDVAFGVVRQLQAAERVARQVHEDDGLGVRIRLGDLRRIGLFRQRADDAPDPIPDVVGRFIDVAIEIELHRDLRALVRAGRTQLVDVLDAGDAVFDRLGDLVLDDLRRGAAIPGLDGDHRCGDVGQLADALPQSE